MLAGSRPKQIMYKQGDELKLCKRPEWGIGTVTRVEHVTRDGAQDQRVWVKFPNVGMKTILAGAADVEILNGKEEEHTFAARENAHEDGWLGEIAKKKPEEAMISLPPDVLDPFTSTRCRLERLLGLYRFNSNGASLIDWAIAQSGLDDPLSRFNRHELEEFFERWAWSRDEHVRTLVAEARRNGEKIEDLLEKATPGAQHAVANGNGRHA